MATHHRTAVCPSYRRLSAMNRHLTVGSHEANGRKQADCTSDAEAQPLFSECDGRPLNRAAKALLVLAVTSAGTAAAVPPPLPVGGIPSREIALGLLELIPPVAIANGTHKYIHLELRLGTRATAGASTDDVVTKRIVRSYRGLKSHAENYRVAMQRTRATLAAVVTQTRGREAAPASTAAGSGRETEVESVLRGLSGQVIGGGRITCDHERRVVSVFGYSRTFGRAAGCNKRTAGLISTHLRYKVAWRDDGY